MCCVVLCCVVLCCDLSICWFHFFSVLSEASRQEGERRKGERRWQKRSKPAFWAQTTARDWCKKTHTSQTTRRTSETASLLSVGSFVRSVFSLSSSLRRSCHRPPHTLTRRLDVPTVAGEGGRPAQVCGGLQTVWLCEGSGRIVVPRLRPRRTSRLPHWRL